MVKLVEEESSMVIVEFLFDFIAGFVDVADVDADWPLHHAAYAWKAEAKFPLVLLDLRFAKDSGVQEDLVVFWV